MPGSIRGCGSGSTPEVGEAQQATEEPTATASEEPTPTEETLPTPEPTAAPTEEPTLPVPPAATEEPLATEEPTLTPDATETALPTETTAPADPSDEPMSLLASAVNAHYWYDGDGQLVKSQIDGVVTYFAGRHYHKNVDGQDVTVQKFYTAGSSQVAVRTITGGQDTLTWILSDHLGSTSVTANADGTLKSEIRYTAFGEVRSSLGTTDTPYQYTGQLSQMEQIGLYYYVARFYDPAIAHFVQADTIVPGPSNPQAYDRFAYALFNPLLYIDPSGHGSVACETGVDIPGCITNSPEGDEPPITPEGVDTGSIPSSRDLSERETKILVAFIAMESSTGVVPLEVDYMKAWALLNKYSYDLAKNGWTPWESWKNHERKLMDGMGITSYPELEQALVLEYYQKKKGVEWFEALELQVRSAVNDWEIYGPGSSKDPVPGAIGFGDLEGTLGPNGEVPDYETLHYDLYKLQNWRKDFLHYPAVSRIYSLGINPEMGEKFDFTVFHPVFVAP